MKFAVDHIHTLYYETFGIRSGIPILFLHGGPGLGFTDRDKRFFDPKKYFVIFYDQRGCGKSTPLGCVEQNTTSHLIEDILHLLDHLSVEKVHMFGGSWGSTLSLIFVHKYPNRVLSLILRGFFSATKETTELYLKGLLKHTHPVPTKRMLAVVPATYPLIAAQYFHEMIKTKKSSSYTLGYEWSRYGLSLSRKNISEHEIDTKMQSNKDDRDKILIELEYALNGFYISETQIFDIASQIENRITIIHGKYDYLCPISDAEKMNSLLPNSNLIVVDAGHSANDPLIEIALSEALTKLCH